MNELSGVPLTDGVYLDKLYKMGVLGPGKRIDSYPLPMEKFANAEYAEALCSAIVNREGIGADLTEGFMRAAEKWNRLEQDLASGWLHKAHWGYGWHWSLPYVEQAYGSLMGDREITEHSFSSSRIMQLMGTPEFNRVSVEKLVEMLSKKTIPYTGDPFMFDYSWQGEDGSNMKQALETGIYSQHKAKFVAWHRHYTRFWAESILYCDRVYPSWFDKNAADLSGQTPESEARFLNAVTGKNLTFADGIKAGRKIWNLNRAIWTLQGRNRNMEKFAEFMYTPEGSIIKSVDFPGLENRKMPVYDHGKWHADPLDTLYLDKNAFEQWKTHYYEFEGWDPETGWPTRGTLEELGLGKVADTLDKAGRLGKSERGE
jgi:aldehyde:ferredoxin oxidoreductase